MKVIVAVVSIAIVAIAGAASAGDLYSTDFEAPTFGLGDVNGQDSWVVGDGSGTSNDGMIVDSGDAHGQVLQVTATGWGDEIKRDYNSASTLQYLVVEMDFQMKGEFDAFWFMDNNSTPSVDPDSIFWDWDVGDVPGRSVFSNANPGITPSAHGKDAWYHVGIEVDQQSREITAFNFQGVWVADDDSAGISTPAQLSRLIFRSWSPGEDTELLWIDNLSITDSSSTVIIPEPASLTLLALAGLLVGLRRRR